MILAPAFWEFCQAKKSSFHCHAQDRGSPDSPDGDIGVDPDGDRLTVIGNVRKRLVAATGSDHDGFTALRRARGDGHLYRESLSIFREGNNHFTSPEIRADSGYHVQCLARRFERF